MNIWKSIRAKIKNLVKRLPFSGKGVGDNIAIAALLISAAFLLFFGGVTVGYLRIGPTPIVRDTIDGLRDLAKNGHAYFFKKPEMHLRPSRFDPAAGVSADTARMEPGVTFLVGLFGNKLGARLYSETGALIHEWPTNFFEIAPDEMAYPFDALLHGAVLYENGDIIVNLDGRGLMRVSACGEVIWRSDGRSHHSIHVDENGYLWTPIYGPAYNEPKIAERPFRFDRVGKFDPDTGEKIAEVDLIKAIVDADAPGIVLANNAIMNDMMHLNDVEILNSQMAGAFPTLSAGDILLSSRHFNQIWILDGKSHRLKYWQTGPMLGQHDPDFQPDGSITIYDNRPMGEPAPANDFKGGLGGSRILKIFPHDRTFETVYQSDEKNTFYSPYRGKHQFLANGNILIAETDAGRAFEVTPDGDVVWSFVNFWDDDEVGWITGATRYPPDFASVRDTKCPGAGQ